MNAAHKAIVQAKIANSLEMNKWARIPLIKYNDKITNIEVNLVANQLLGIFNSALINSYVQCDERCQKLAIYLKRWAKHRDLKLIGADRGYLSSYAINLLLIAYLQNLDPPILPNLQQKSNSKYKNTNQIEYPVFDGAQSYSSTVDIYFMQDIQNAHKRQINEINYLSYAEIMAGFFRFYGWEFDVNNNIYIVFIGKETCD